MSESSPIAPVSESSLAAALGKIPSGLFVVTCRHAGGRAGLLASWVQQAGFAPPMVTVAVRRDRPMVQWLDETKRLVLCQVATENRKLLKQFARPQPPGVDPFDGLELATETEGGPVPADALAYLDAVIVGHVEGGDHRVYLAEVVGGAVLHTEATPMVHIRKNGLSY